MKIFLKSLWSWGAFAFVLSSLLSCEQQEFVTLEEGQFVYQGEPFFPVMINYVLEFREVDNVQYTVPLKEYDQANVFESNSREELMAEYRGHLQIMKDMGFNSVRLCMDRIEVDEHGYFYPTDSAGSSKRLYLKHDTEKILSAYELYVETAAEMDMRIMWLLKPPLKMKSYGNSLKRCWPDLATSLHFLPTTFLTNPSTLT